MFVFGRIRRQSRRNRVTRHSRVPRARRRDGRRLFRCRRDARRTFRLRIAPSDRAPLPCRQLPVSRRVLAAARQTGADAIHPGYGSLLKTTTSRPHASRPTLSSSVRPEVIARMGSKVAARATGGAAGVPVVPGETPRSRPTQRSPRQRDAWLPGSDQAIRRRRRDRDEGGARGDAQLLPAIAQSRREALAAFGDGTLTSSA